MTSSRHFSTTAKLIFLDRCDKRNSNRAFLICRFFACANYTCNIVAKTLLGKYCGDLKRVNDMKIISLNSSSEKHVYLDIFFLWYIFWHVQIMKNHVFCYNFSCVNVCEIGIYHLLHLFIRYTMYLFLYRKCGALRRLVFLFESQSYSIYWEELKVFKNE